jgi:hypothetical protein
MAFGRQRARQNHGHNPTRIVKVLCVPRFEVGNSSSRLSYRIAATCTRLRRRPVRISEAQNIESGGAPVQAAARQLGVSVNTYQKARRTLYQQTPPTIG